MKRLPRPTEPFGSTYDLCVAQVQSADLRDRLVGSKALVEESATEYATAASNARLHTIPRLVPSVGTVTSDELKGLYERLRRKETEARVVYERILLAPRNSVCPLCGVGTATTLDHHLPHSDYAALAVVPDNLVPACMDCQMAKLKKWPGGPEQQTLHPYFDGFYESQWLKAEVVQANPPAIRFFCEPPEGWSDVQRARVQHHFQIFGLGRVYALRAAEELTIMHAKLGRLHQCGGSEAVSRQLLEDAVDMRALDPNDWRTAMYGACGGSGWFCESGHTMAGLDNALQPAVSEEEQN